MKQPSGFLYWAITAGCILLLAGGLVISLTGIRLTFSRNRLRHPESVQARAVSPARHAEEALNGFLISVTNPGTLVCMLWLFTFLGMDTSRSTVMLSEWAGTSLGSATSWFLITWSISSFRDRITIGQLHTLTRVCGAAILIIGLASAVKSLPLLF